MEISVGKLWRAGRDRLAAGGIDMAALDARLLAQHVLNRDATALIAGERDRVNAQDRSAFDRLVARRLAGEPVARITGSKEFYGLDFGLNGATLVPRPETEMLVDFALASTEGDGVMRVLDLGTGTGCIPLAMLVNRVGWQAVAIDLAPEAVAQARRNAGALGVADRFDAREGSWFAPLRAGERFDLIASNPPYITTLEMASLPVDVRAYDPELALDGGADGLAPYRVIASNIARWLVPGGRVVLEIGTGQGRAVAGLLRDAGLDMVVVHNDLSGHERMVTAIAR